MVKELGGGGAGGDVGDRVKQAVFIEPLVLGYLALYTGIILSFI